VVPPAYNIHAALNQSFNIPADAIANDPQVAIIAGLISNYSFQVR
jgi:hypothetical protein